MKVTLAQRGRQALGIAREVGTVLGPRALRWVIMRWVDLPRLVASCSLVLLLGCDERLESRARPHEPKAPTAPTCREVTAPADEPPEGPFPTLEAVCEHARGRGGNDAPRVCRLVGETVSQPRASERRRGGILAAQLVAHDFGGDFVYRNLALRTAKGWWVFGGAVCDNTMNDHAYRVDELALAWIARPEADPVVLRRFRVAEPQPHSSGTFVSLCGVTARAAPACVTFPDVLRRGDVVVDYGFGMQQNGAIQWRVPPRAGERTPWITFMNFPSNWDFEKRLGVRNRYCLPF